MDSTGIKVRQPRSDNAPECKKGYAGVFNKKLENGEEKFYAGKDSGHWVRYLVRVCKQ